MTLTNTPTTLASLWIAVLLVAVCNTQVSLSLLHPTTTTTTTLTSSRAFSFQTAHSKPGLTCQPPSITTTTGLRRETKLFSILDSLLEGLLAPSRPILDGKKDLLKSLLAGTYLEQNNNIDSIQCCYKASRDGWSAVNFHDAVDNKGSGLVVARTLTGVTFGGFNPNGWRSTDDYYLSNAAFLWYVKSNLLGGKDVVVKCPIGSSSNAAIYDYATGGPCFGSSDLVIGEPRAAVMGGFTGPDMENIAASAGDLKRGRCSFSGAYDFDEGWPVRGAFSLIEMEVYCKNDSLKKKSFW